jgi:hypothetical protein
MRPAQPDWYPTKAALFIGNLVIFFIPSVGALLITPPEAWRSTSLTVAWVAAVVVLVGPTALASARWSGVSLVRLTGIHKKKSDSLTRWNQEERRGSSG